MNSPNQPPCSIEVPVQLMRPKNDEEYFEPVAMAVIETIDLAKEGPYQPDIERIKALDDQIALLEAKEERQRKAEFEASLKEKGLRCVEKLCTLEELVKLKSVRLQSILRVMEMMECDLCREKTQKEMRAKWQKINEERLTMKDSLSPLEHARLMLKSFEPKFVEHFYRLLQPEIKSEAGGETQEEEGTAAAAASLSSPSSSPSRKRRKCSSSSSSSSGSGGDGNGGGVAASSSRDLLNSVD